MLYLSSKLRESFPYFSQRSLSYLFLLKGSWQKYQNYNSTLKFGEEKLSHCLFWSHVNLFHVVINLCWFFLCQLFSKELRGKKVQANTSSILYDARQKKQKILLTFFHNLVEKIKLFQALTKWFRYYGLCM